jgi:hypothetical protein
VRSVNAEAWAKGAQRRHVRLVMVLSMKAENVLVFLEVRPVIEKNA